MKRKILAVLLCVTIGLIAMMAPTWAAPAKDNANQNFTGTPVVVDAPGSVLVGEAAQIVITVTDVAARGLPQVSIWVNGGQVAFWSEIKKGGVVQFIIDDIDTSAAGNIDFEIAVWTRLGNKNFEDALYCDITTIAVVAPEPEIKTPAEWLEDFNAALQKALEDGTFEVTYFNNKSYVTLTVDGENYVFEGNGNSDRSPKSLVMDGVKYEIHTSNNNPPVYIVRFG